MKVVRVPFGYVVLHQRLNMTFLLEFDFFPDAVYRGTVGHRCHLFYS